MTAACVYSISIHRYVYELGTAHSTTVWSSENVWYVLYIGTFNITFESLGKNPDQLSLISLIINKIFGIFFQNNVIIGISSCS